MELLSACKLAGPQVASVILVRNVHTLHNFDMVEVKVHLVLVLDRGNYWLNDPDYRNYNR